MVDKRRLGGQLPPRPVCRHVWNLVGNREDQAFLAVTDLSKGQRISCFQTTAETEETSRNTEVYNGTPWGDANSSLNPRTSWSAASVIVRKWLPPFPAEPEDKLANISLVLFSLSNKRNSLLCFFQN